MHQFSYIVCLILGLAGILLFCVGFALPYWFQEPAVNGSSHGLWHRRECQANTCSMSRIDFGVTAPFEACRVFSCATILMALVAFSFNGVLIKKSTKTWVIRTGAVWGCTALFNVLEALLFGLTERQTLEKLNLVGVNTSGVTVERLDWGYWVTIASLVIFSLLTILCGYLACSTKVHDDSKSDSSLTKRLRNSKRQESTFNHIGMYPDDQQHGASMVATGEMFPPDIGRTVINQQSLYPVNQLSSNYIVQPSPVAANIDTQRMPLNVRDGSRYVGPSIQGPQNDNNTSGGSKFILNRPNVYNANLSRDAITVSNQGYANQDNVYSFNVNRSGSLAANSQPTGTSLSHAASSTDQQLNVKNVPIAATTTGQTFVIGGDGGPPPYTTLPRDNSQPFGTVAQPNLAAFNRSNVSSNLQQMQLNR